MRRNNSTLPTLAELESGTEQHDPIEAPGIMPPAGVPAKVKTQIEYTRQVDPDNDDRQPSRYSQELEDLAEEEDEQLAPRDPLTEFIDRWQRYAGYTLRIVRLPDPINRRSPGFTYRRPNFTHLENLGDTYFEPANLIGTLQTLNQNSGGVFRIFLVDPATNELIPGGILNNLAIADPPEFTTRERTETRTIEREPAPPPQKSESEQHLERIKNKLFEDVLARALQPPPVAPVNTDPLANVDPATRATLFLVQQGNLLPTVVENITRLAGAGAAAPPEKESLGERFLGMVAHVAENNPQIIERVSSTLERIVNRVLPDPNAPKITTPVQYQQPMQRQPQAQRATATIPATAAPISEVNTGLPEVPQPGDDPWEDDEEEMAIFDELIAFLIGTEPISLTHPALVELTKKYPVKTRLVASAIGQMTLEQIIEYISNQSVIYDALLKQEYNVSRLAELRRQIQNAGKQPQPETKPETAVAPATTEG